MDKYLLIDDLYIVRTFENSESDVNATIELNKDHEIFKGHFPGNPVMPGVCMIQIIKELTERAVGSDLFLSTCSNIKFMAIINPEENDMLQLNMEITENDDEVKVKNSTFFDDTLALKLSATFKIIG